MMTAFTRRLGDIVASIYDAALDPTRWDDALDRVNVALGYAASGLRLQSHSTGRLWVRTRGFEPSFEAAYLGHFHREDPYAPRIMMLGEGETLACERAIPRHELEQTGYYNELCRPYGLEAQAGGALLRSDDEFVMFGAMTPKGRRADPEDAALAMLLPHFRRAFEIQRRVHASEEVAAATWAALDRLPMSVFLLDRHHRVERTNRAADQLLARGDVFVVAQRTLDVVWSANAASLASALTDRGGPPVPFDRPGKRPLLGASLPLGASASTLETAVGGRMLVVVDPEDEPTTPAAALEALFGLTRAEARVALLVASGHSPRSAADVLGTTWNTVRGQLKQIYAKTDTSGQPELARLIARLSLLPPG